MDGCSWLSRGLIGGGWGCSGGSDRIQVATEPTEGEEKEAEEGGQKTLPKGCGLHGRRESLFSATSLPQKRRRDVIALKTIVQSPYCFEWRGGQPAPLKTSSLQTFRGDFYFD